MAVHAQRCANCGFENVPAAKFCANCGKPLTSAAAAPLLSAESRKIITAVFVDLAGSTGLTERLDPEEARDVVGRFYRTVQRTVERFGGTIANLLGDGVLAVFGLPVSHEDDPERAVRAGLAIRDALPDLNREIAALHDVRLGIRIGINTGEVVAASGSTFDRDFLISDAVTTAARLQQNVATGSIVVGERTYVLTREVIEYRDLPPMDVKGKAAPLRVWEAIAPLPEPQDAGRGAAPLVGRHSDLMGLRFAYERSRGESLVQLVTLLGQAGMGKSRLLREFLAECSERQPAPLVLRGRSAAFGGQIGYHALLDILRGQSGWLDTDSPEEVREKLARWLDKDLPDHAHLLDGLLLTFGASNGEAANPQQTRRALFDAWKRLLTGLAEIRPVVAVFEDVHWADEGVLDLIQEIVSGDDGVPLLVTCLARPELLERRPDWGTRARNVVKIDLIPLRARETAALVDLLGRDVLTPEMREKVARRAEGNPLFAEELVRMLLEGARPAAAGEAAIPDTVQAVITARIDRLPTDERRALQGAAVIGRTFWPSAVGLLAGFSNGDVYPPLERLTAKQLIAGHAQSTIAGEQEYAFRQLLTRDVAYGMLPRSQRQRAHALAAGWLEERLGDRVEEVVEVLAEHLRMAGDDAKAATYLHRAGNKARRLYANADAVRLFDQALEAAQKAGLDHQLPLLRRDRGEVHQLMGAYAAALADFEAGLAAARQAGDRWLEAMLENRVGFVHHREARLDQAEEHFRRAASLAREIGDRQVLGATLIDLATVAWDRGEMPSVDQILAEGIGLLKDTEDRSNLARAHNLRSMAHLAMGNMEHAIAAAQDALATAREAGDRSREATSLSYLGVLYSWLARLVPARDYFRSALEIAEAIGDRRRASYVREFMVIVDIFAGDWGDGIRRTEDLLPEAGELTPLELPYVHLFLGDLYFEVGDQDRALRSYSASASLEATSPWRMITALARLNATRIQGDRAAMGRALDEILSLPTGVFNPNEIQLLGPLADALLEMDRADDLRRLIEARRPAVERFNASWVFGMVALIEALLAVHDGDRHTAAAKLDEALRLAESGPNAIALRRVLEARVEFFNRPEDRAALRQLCARIAAGLPDDLRTVFLSSPRVAPFLGTPA